MSYRKAVQYLLLAFVAASVIYLVAQQGGSSDLKLPASVTTEAASTPAPAESLTTQPAAQAAQPAPGAEEARPAAAVPKPAPRPPQITQKILVYYFFTTVRCPSCRYIEATTQEALMQNFADALANGSVEWRPVNVQLPQNRHYIRDYQLFTKSVVVARVKDGQQLEWKNLERVWELVGNSAAFHRYIRDEVQAYLRKS